MTKEEQQSNQKNSNQKEGTLSKEDYWDYVDESEDNLKDKNKNDSND